MPSFDMSNFMRKNTYNFFFVFGFKKEAGVKVNVSVRRYKSVNGIIFDNSKMNLVFSNASGLNKWFGFFF